MAIDASVGNVISRLQGLKNVSGRSERRRVMPESGFLDELQQPEAEIEGTSQTLPDFSKFQSPNSNIPEADLGGELTPQSYDIRANVANPPAQEPGFWSRIGQALADYVSPEKRAEMSIANQSLFNQNKDVAQTPPIATAQVDMQEGIPPVTASEQQEARVRNQPPQPSSGILGALSDYLNPTKRSQMSAYNSDQAQDLQLQLQGSSLDEEIAKHNQSLQADVQKAMENPGNFAVYGAANQVANHPALQAKFKEITGIDSKGAIAEKVSQYEQSMQGVEDSLNGINTELDETAEGIRQRILNNQSTDADKFYIGLALLMPLIIGGLFGKEAALGALGGTSQGFADVLQGRQKSIQDDEQTLLQIAKEKAQNQSKLGEIGFNKAQFGENLRKNLPKDPNDHLIGMKEGEWTDPQTGKTVKGIRLKPGLVARPEYTASKEGLTDMRKAANELAEVKTYVDDVNQLTDEVSEIVSQLKDPSSVWKGFSQILTKTSPTALAKLSQDVMFEGRKQNAGVLLEEKLGFLANKYGMAQELGQLDRAAQAHIKKIIENPTNSFISPRDSLNQVLAIRDLSQRGLIRSASNKGFYPEFVLADMEEVNQPLYNRLNKKEDEKVISDIEKKLSQNEMNYAK